MDAIELVREEREKQIHVLGYSPSYDKEENSFNQLSDAALGLLVAVPDDPAFIEEVSNNPPEGWNRQAWRKLVAKPYKERLIIGAALLCAEYDRINN